MTEKNFSANFSLFNGDGLKVQFTVREDDPDRHMQILSAYLDHQLKAGWRVVEPIGNARPKTVRIVGWVLSSAEDKRTATYKPCVHCYAPYGDFKVITVYHERIGELPIDISQATVWDGAAPDRETALKRGVMNSCDFEILIEPVLDSDGVPLLTEKGNPKTRFGGVKGAVHVPPMAEIAELNPEPTPESFEAIPSAILGMITDAQRGTFNSLGMALSGTKEKWDENRPKMVLAVAPAKTSHLTLTQAEASIAITKMEEKLRGYYEKLSTEMMEAGIVEANDLADIDDLFGVELVHAYTALTKSKADHQVRRQSAQVKAQQAVMQAGQRRRVAV